jgi:hypothetical protein
MIVTKEHQEALVTKYHSEGHSHSECMSFIDGLNKAWELISKTGLPK